MEKTWFEMVGADFEEAFKHLLEQIPKAKRATAFTSAAFVERLHKEAVVLLRAALPFVTNADHVAEDAELPSRMRSMIG